MPRAKKIKYPKEFRLLKRQINKVRTIKTGTYSVNTFQMGESGLEKAGVSTIKFIRGTKDNLERQKGFTTETLLNVILTHLNAVSTEVPDDHTAQAIVDIESALEHLDLRSKERFNTGVLFTKQVTPK